MLSFKIIVLLVGGGGRFLKVFTIYRRGGHLGRVTMTIYICFLSPFPRRLNMKSGVDWPSVNEHVYIINSPCEPNGSGELKVGFII